MEGIQQMFSEFMGYDEYDAQLTIWCINRHHDHNAGRRDHFRRNKKREREYYRENRDWILRRSRHYYVANREQILEKQKARKPERMKWNDKHRDILRASDRKWREKLPADECWCRAKKVPGRSLCHEHLMANRKRSAERYAAKKQQEGRVG